MFEWLPLSWGQTSHFHFLRPWWLLALLPLLWTLRHLWSASNPIGKWRKVIAPHLLKAMLVQGGRANWFNPLSVSVLVVMLGVTALAGPSWRQQPSPFAEDIAALVIMLDVSSSMQQDDIQPSRLERAKQKVQDLLAQRPGGRVALIVYSGSAHSVIPLTNDADIVNNFLDAIVIEMMPRAGEFPEKALPIARQILSDSPVPGTVLMIGDGLSTRTIEDFTTFFAAEQHQLLILGIGSESVVGSETDATLIPLERSALQKLARSSDGYYQALSLDKEDVANLNRRINNYLVIVDDESRPWVDAGYYLLYPMALLLLLWFRRGWTLHWCLALLFITSLTPTSPLMASDTMASETMTSKTMTSGQSLSSRFMDLWLTPDQQGRYYLEQGDYKKAAASFENIAWRGIAYYRSENFTAAAEMFSRIETLEGFFNLANALAQGRNYLAAVRAYDEALKLAPEHRSALKNRAKIQGIIDEINLLSASQKSEAGESSKELGEDQPQTADGAEHQDFVEREVEQLSAEQVLLDEQINELWMRQVQKDPSRFLSSKFHRQWQKTNQREKGGDQSGQ